MTQRILCCCSLRGTSVLCCALYFRRVASVDASRCVSRPEYLAPLARFQNKALYANLEKDDKVRTRLLSPPSDYKGFSRVSCCSNVTELVVGIHQYRLLYRAPPFRFPMSQHLFCHPVRSSVMQHCNSCTACKSTNSPSQPPKPDSTCTFTPSTCSCLLHPQLRRLMRLTLALLWKVSLWRAKATSPPMLC